MEKKNIGNVVGSWAFLVGVVLAVLFGVFGAVSASVAWALVVIGLVVGFFNVVDEEIEPFLLSGVVLIIASALGSSAVSVSVTLDNILKSLLLIFVPATIVVALKNVFSLARN